MNIVEVMQELYRRRIDCGLETFSGSGVTAWVVDARNRRLERQFAVDDMSSLSAWLLAEANRIEVAEATRQTNVGSLLGNLGTSPRKPAVRVSSNDRDRRQPPASLHGTSD